MLNELKKMYWRAREYPPHLAQRWIKSMNPKPQAIAIGICSLLPYLNRLNLDGVLGLSTARICYSVWLRHLVTACRNGLNSAPSVVAELGPGNSLGVGIAALLTGADKYFAFDVVPHAGKEENIRILYELVDLFKSCAAIPDATELPEVKPYLDDYSFPFDVLSPVRLSETLNERRIEKIRASLVDPNLPDSMVRYKAPWLDSQVVVPESVDVIISQAVMEHVDDLQNVYRAMNGWLRPGGFVSHQIDFKSHGTAKYWNGHWTYSDFTWSVIRGRRPYLLNREPFSTHVRLLGEEGFHIVHTKKVRIESLISQNDLAHRFVTLSDDDFSTSSALVQAVKR